MRDFRAELAQAVAPLAGMPAGEMRALFEVPSDPKYGHFALPCFKLAAAWKKAPQAIAAELSGKLSQEAGLMEMCESILPAGPYVNFTLKASEFSLAVLDAVLSGAERYGFSPLERRKRILVEHMNANPNKPLHLGQARNICLADSLIRMLRFLGNQVHSINYGDDSGVNIAFNIVAHLHYGVPFDPPRPEKFDHYCGKVYTLMRQREETDGKFKELRLDVSKKIEEGNNTVAEFQRQYTERCAIAQFESCWRLGVFFELVNWETDIIHMKFFEHAMERLKETPYVYLERQGEHANCWVIDLSKLEGFEGLRMPTAVLIKSDGTAMYVAKDIAYAMWKLGILGRDFDYAPLVEQPNGQWLWSTISSPKESRMPKKPDFGHYDTAIAVIDKRQTHEQNVVKAALGVLGFTGVEKEYVHLPYGVVYLTPRTLEHFGFSLTEEEKKEKRLPFASRKGWFITIDETLDQLKTRVYAASKERNPDRDEAWLQDISERIAVAALRFFLTKLDKNKDLTFDIEEALDLEGETGPYVQYSHARACAILRKASEQGIDAGALKPGAQAASLLSEEKERALLSLLTLLPGRVEESARTLSPDILSMYLLEVGQLFNSYYNSSPVLQSEPAVRDARLLLVRAVRQVLANGLSLLGIHAPERM